jgi:hypothetical protein
VAAATGEVVAVEILVSAWAPAAVSRGRTAAETNSRFMFKTLRFRVAWLAAARVICDKPVYVTFRVV